MTKRYEGVREDCRIDNTVTCDLRIYTIPYMFPAVFLFIFTTRDLYL